MTLVIFRMTMHPYPYCFYGKQIYFPSLMLMLVFNSASDTLVYTRVFFVKSLTFRMFCQSQRVIIEVVL